MSGNTRHSPVRMSKQIYAEAESNARGRRQMQTSLHAAEDYYIAEAIQYKWTRSG